jgi:hypothetical protein
LRLAYGRRAVALPDTFEPAFRTFEMFEAGEHRIRLAACRDRKARGHQRILDLEATDQRQAQGDCLAAMFECELLGKAVDGGFDDTDTLPSPIAARADGHQPQAALARRIDHLRRAIMIDGDHGSAAGWDEIAEQPQLGVEVMRDIGMIVHVIARQVGEAACRNAHAVETVLIESVRGRFESKMRDAVARDLVELLM